MKREKLFLPFYRRGQVGRFHAPCCLIFGVYTGLDIWDVSKMESQTICWLTAPNRELQYPIFIPIPSIAVRFIYPLFLDT